MSFQIWPLRAEESTARHQQILLSFQIRRKIVSSLEIRIKCTKNHDFLCLAQLIVSLYQNIPHICQFCHIIQRAGPKILNDRRDKSIFLLSLSSDKYGIGMKGQKIALKFNCCRGSLGGSMSDIFVNSQRGECA